MFLTRDVEGQGIGQTRSAGRRQAGSVIWRMIPVERASVKHTPRSHLTHLDVGGDARGRSLTLTLTLRTVVQNVRLGLDHDRDQQHVFVFSVWHAASPGSLAPLDFRLHAFVDRSISCLVVPIRSVPKSDDQLALPVRLPLLRFSKLHFPFHLQPPLQTRPKSKKR